VVSFLFCFHDCRYSMTATGDFVKIEIVNTITF
jgi:hypothetical protein